MAAKNKTKYSYGESGSKDLYGVDAPDFRESEAFTVYVDTVKAIIYATDEITSRAIKAELGDLNNDHWTAAALDRLCSGNDVTEVGVQWIRYRKGTPIDSPKPIVVNREKLAEFKAYQRQWWAAYATGGYEIQERA